MYFEIGHKVLFPSVYALHAKPLLGRHIERDWHEGTILEFFIRGHEDWCTIQIDQPTEDYLAGIYKRPLKMITPVMKQDVL